MKHHIAFPRSEGTHSRQAHCDLPEGTYEREFGKEGFFGPATHLIHANPPTGWSDWQGEHRPRAYDLTKLASSENTPWNATPVLSNAAMKFRFWRTEGAMDHLVCNADGDDLLFVHAGEGSLFCDFGHLTFREGDYIMLPRGTRWRLECAAPTALLLMEATNDSYKLPDKGMVGPHAVFDAAVLDVPAIDEAYRAQKKDGDWRVIIKRGATLSTVTYPFNPLDVVV